MLTEHQHASKPDRSGNAATGSRAAALLLYSDGIITPDYQNTPLKYRDVYDSSRSVFLKLLWTVNMDYSFRLKQQESAFVHKLLKSW